MSRPSSSHPPLPPPFDRAPGDEDQWHHAQAYTISDGKLVLTLEAAAEGGFVVSSPLYPGLWTQAESVAEAFENAGDVLAALAAACRKPVATAAGRGKATRREAARLGTLSPVARVSVPTP